MAVYEVYYLKKPTGSPMGPLSVDIIEALVKQGEITADYLFAPDGSEVWKPIAELPVLAHALFSPSELQQTPHVKPPTHLGWGIVLTIFGFFPLGILAIVKSLKVAEHYGAGRYAEARRASDAVRNICILNIVVSVMLIISCSVVVNYYQKAKSQNYEAILHHTSRW